MSGKVDIDRAVKQVAQATGAIAEWLDDHGSGNRLIGKIAAARVGTAVNRLQHLSRAVGRRAGLAVLSTEASIGHRIATATAGAAGDGLVVLGGGDVRLPSSGGLWPSSDRHGPSLVIRYSSEARSKGNGAGAVGRMLGTSRERTDRVTANGIRIEILSYADLLSILARAYLTHVRSEPGEPFKSALATAIAEENNATPAAAIEPGLTRQDVDGIRDCLERSFHGHPHLTLLRSSGYWASLGTLAPRSSRTSRRRLASFLWGGLAEFDAYAAVLGEALEALNHSSEILCASDAVVQSENGVLDTVHPASVLAAGTILDGDDESAVEVRTRHAGTLRLPRKTIAAIASEIVVNAETPRNGRMRDFDVLHVPLPQIDVAPRLGESPFSRHVPGRPYESKWLSAVFMEAKALHLAGRLVDRLDITAMVAVPAPDRPLPLSMAALLTRWVRFAAGETPRERDGNGDVLVVAAMADSPGQAADAGLTWSSLQEFRKRFGPECAWLDEWGQGTAFDRVVLLGRRLDDAKAVLPAAPPGSGRALARLDLGGKPAPQVTRDNVRRSSLALDEALTAGDGGMRYLIETIAGLNMKRLRHRQLAREVGEVSRSLSRPMRCALLGSDGDADIDWRRRLSLQTQAWARGVGRAGRMGHLVAALLPSERIMADMLAPLLAAQDEDLEPSDICRRVGDRALAAWIEAVLAWSASDLSRKFNAGADGEIAILVDELALSAVRNDLAGRIAAAALPVMSGAVRAPDIVAARLSRTIVEIIAGHVSELGFDGTWSTRRPRRPGTFGAPLFDRTAPPNAAASGQPLAARLADQHVDDWCEAFPILVEENIAAARIVRMDERALRELAGHVEQLAAIGRRGEA